MNASRSFVVNKLTQTLFCCMRQLHLLVRFIICCLTQTVRMQMNDMSKPIRTMFCCMCELNLLVRCHYLSLIADGQDANERQRVLLSSANPPENVLLLVLASFAGQVALFVAYCRWSVRHRGRFNLVKPIEQGLLHDCSLCLFCLKSRQFN